MTVRSKMSPGYTPGRGERGAELWFNVVSESNDELKSISENAIYGKSSPSGSLELAGEFPVEKFQGQDAAAEEYYVDMYAAGTQPSAPDLLFCCHARKVYQSSPSVDSMGQAIINFRYVITEPRLGGTYRIGCANPPASSWLIDNDDVVIGVLIAKGRKSDREIELRRKLFVDQVTSVLGYNKFETAAEASTKLMGWTKSCRFRVWRSLGERGEMPDSWDDQRVIGKSLAAITFKVLA